MNLFSNKNNCICLELVCPNYGNRLNLHELNSDFSKGESTLHWEGLRRAVHLTLQREEQLSGWTLGRRESTFWGRIDTPNERLDTLEGESILWGKNQHSIGGLTLRAEYGNFGGRISTPREGGSTLEKSDQHFGDRIDHNVWSNVISWVTTFLNSRS